MGSYTLRVETLQGMIDMSTVLGFCGVEPDRVEQTEDCRGLVYPLHASSYRALMTCVDDLATATIRLPIISRQAQAVREQLRGARTRHGVTLAMCDRNIAPQPLSVLQQSEVAAVLAHFQLARLANDPVAGLHGTVVGYHAGSAMQKLIILYADIHRQPVHNAVAQAFTSLFQSGIHAVGLEGISVRTNYPTCRAYQQPSLSREWSNGLWHAIDQTCHGAQRVFGIEDPGLQRQAAKLLRQQQEGPRIHRLLATECFYHNVDDRSIAAADNVVESLGEDRVAVMLMGMAHVDLVTQQLRTHDNVAYVVVLPQSLSQEDYLDVLIASRRRSALPTPAYCPSQTN